VCRASKNEEVTAPAAEASSGATAQPETEAMEATHTVVLEEEGLWIAEEAAAHAQNVVAELGLSRALPQSLTPEVHAQRVVAEPCPISGEPGGLKKVARAQPIAAEPDLPGGQPGDPNANARAHLASAEPNDLQTEGDKDLLEVEEEGAAVNAAVESDVDPRVDLQGNGVSHPIMPNEDMFLTFPSSPLHNTLEAARMQRSPPVDEGTPPIEGPEPSGRANTAPPPLDIPPPEKAAEPPDWPSPEQARAPVDAEGLLEPSPGEAPQCTTRHESLASARALEGIEHLGVAHGPPPDPSDPRIQSPIALELGIVILKARRPVSDEGARARPVPWPGPDANTTDLDVYQRASVLLEGEQNKFLPCEGSEQHAAPCTPHPHPFSPLRNACARGIAPGEGAAPVRRAADPHLEALTPPHLCEDPPDEAGGVGLGPVHAAGKAGAVTLDRVVVDAHGPGGASLDADADTAPTPTEGTASVKLIGVAEKAATAEPEALEPRAEGAARRRLETPPLLPPREGSGVLGTPPRETPLTGILAAQEGAPTVLRNPAPGHFEESPPWDIEGEPGGTKKFDLKRPFEAKKVDSAGHTGHHKNEPGHTKIESVQQHHRHKNNHIPLALDLSSRAALEIVKHPGLEPEREGVAVRVVLWQNKTLPRRTQPSRDKSRRRHANSRVWHRVARWPHPGRGHRIKQWAPPSIKENISQQCPDCTK
jgi:hypothetical protein